MNGSFRLGSYAGIPIKVHWSFGLIFLLVAYISYQEQLDIFQSIGLVVYILVLFVIVVMHEYGHALTAKYYNIKTKDIILSPIGGLARMKSFPSSPKKELFIAVAGPLVNLIIAIIICLILLLQKHPLIPEAHPYELFTSPNGFLQMLLWMNIVLFVFNLIPAFPMDGGRILRALLSFKLNRNLSTKIASYIGQIFAIAFVIFGIFTNHFVLIFIGGFIFLQALQERRQVALQDKLSSGLCKDLVETENYKVYNDQQLFDYIELIKATKDQSFLVFDRNEQLIGTLPNLFIQDAIQNKNQKQIISTIMSPKKLILDEQTTLIELFDILKTKGLAAVAISREGYIIGKIDRERLSDFMRP